MNGQGKSKLMTKFVKLAASATLASVGMFAADAAPSVSSRILTEYGRSVQRDAYGSALAMIEGILGYLDFNTEVVDFGITKDGYGIEPLSRDSQFRPE